MSVTLDVSQSVIGPQVFSVSTEFLSQSATAVLKFASFSGGNFVVVVAVVAVVVVVVVVVAVVVVVVVAVQSPRAALQSPRRANASFRFTLQSFVVVVVATVFTCDGVVL